MNKVETVIRKLNLPTGGDNSNDKRRIRLLDVGCGWGRIADYIGERTGAQMDAITISKEQANYARKHLKNVRVHLGHYQTFQAEELYDAVYSIGIMEHIGCPRYDEYFEKMRGLVVDNGTIFLHTIINLQDSGETCTLGNKSFITTRIFPDGKIPDTQWIIDSARKSDLTLHHYEIYGGHHYARTLHLWRENLLKNQHMFRRDRSIIRMYEIYLAMCEAAFSDGQMGLAHFVFKKNPYGK
jgi:cyclopropane-fatty-acyl-phospholipid synthase